MNTVISETLKSLSIGQPVRHGPMVMFPLLENVGAYGRAAPSYAYLDEMLKSGKASIEEISEGGSVPDLLLHNMSDTDILLVEGDHLVGAKQNRTLNSSILAPARSSLIIPVSCVERGRWSSRSKNFQYSDDFQFAKGRRGKVASVSESMKYSRSPATPNRASDQGEVWSAIERKQHILRARSATSSMSDVYEDKRSQLDSFQKQFSYYPGQVGAFFAVADEVAGFEYFEHADTLRKYLPRLIRSYAMDAIELPFDSVCQCTVDDVSSTINEVTSSEISLFASVGKGQDARIDSDKLAGGGLLLDQRLIHLSVFRKQRSSQNYH
jgi:hypothetical protein